MDEDMLRRLHSLTEASTSQPAQAVAGLTHSNSSNLLASPMRNASSIAAPPPGIQGSPSRSPFWSPKTRVTYGDRFIPSRAAAARLDFSILDREVAASESAKSASQREEINPAYSMLLRSELLGDPSASLTSPDKSAAVDHLRSPCSPSKGLFRFKAGDAGSPMGGPAPQSPFSMSPVGGDSGMGVEGFASPRKAVRKIARAPFKVLDAPSLQDDFYLNLVDWSSQNVLAVGLGSCVYMWSAHTSKVTKLTDLAPSDTVASVGWSQRGTYLVIGCNSGKIEVWDAGKLERVRVMDGHRARVGALSWGAQVLSTASRDRMILQRDLRSPEHYISKLVGHRSEVCGLKWSPDDRQLASGGNDNQMCIWDIASNQPFLRFHQHTAAVKAIAWSPHTHGLLASGGGTADRHIRFFNTTNGAALQHIDTGSQVCNLAWNKNVNEIVSTHGYSQNQIVVWKYPSMTKQATLTGHSLRVLFLAVSPDGQTIVTGAGDETLRFWSVFPGPPAAGTEVSSVRSSSRNMIR